MRVRWGMIRRSPAIRLAHRAHLARWGGGIAILLLLVVIAMAPASPTVSASGVTVQMPPGNTFAPADITVTAGTTVTWIDDDTAEPLHNLEESVGAFGSPDLAYGQSYSFTFAANFLPGKYYYYCTLHGAMTGTVTVLPPPSPTPIPQPTRHPGTATAPGSIVLPATHAAVPTQPQTVRTQPRLH